MIWTDGEEFENRYGPKHTRNGVDLYLPSFCLTIIVSLTPVNIAFSSKGLQTILAASKHDLNIFIIIIFE